MATEANTMNPTTPTPEHEASERPERIWIGEGGLIGRWFARKRFDDDIPYVPAAAYEELREAANSVLDIMVQFQKDDYVVGCEKEIDALRKALGKE